MQSARRLAPVIAVTLVVGLAAPAMGAALLVPAGDLDASTPEVAPRVAPASNPDVLQTASGRDTSAADPPIHGPPDPTDNTTARLTLDRGELRRAGYETQRPNLASTVATGDQSFRLLHERYVVEDRFERAEGVESKRQVVDEALIDLEDRAEALVERQDQLIQGYSNGLVTKRALLSGLARIDGTAGELQRSATHVRALVRRANADWFNPRVRQLLAQLETLQGPVRDRVGAAMAAGRTLTVHVVANDHDLVLATIDDGRYFREAHFGSNRRTNGSVELDGFRDGVVRAEDYYGWAIANSFGNTGFGLSGDIFQFDVDHPHGQLAAFFDVHTGEVFHEVQRLRVGAMPTEPLTTTTNFDYRVRLNRTYPGGPLTIAVTAANSGEPLDVGLAIDGRDVGHTGDDGVLRVVEPVDPYSVEVQGSAGTMNVTVDEDDFPD